MTYLRAAAVLVLLGACGTDPAGDGPDAGRAPVTTDVTCLPYIRTASFNDGRRTVRTTRVGSVDSIGPDAAFLVELCDLTQQPPATSCPADADCVGANGPNGQVCVRSYRSGTFIDGKLQIICGDLVETFSAANVSTSRSEYRYATARVTVY